MDVALVVVHSLAAHEWVVIPPQASGSHYVRDRLAHRGKHRYHRESYRHHDHRLLVVGWLADQPLVVHSLVEPLADWLAAPQAHWLAGQLGVVSVERLGEQLQAVRLAESLVEQRS